MAVLWVSAGGSSDCQWGGKRALCLDDHFRILTVEYKVRAVSFASADLELFDRIENAMTLLQISCDTTADTGF